MTDKLIKPASRLASPDFLSGRGPRSKWTKERHEELKAGLEAKRLEPEDEYFLMRTQTVIDLLQFVEDIVGVELNYLDENTPTEIQLLLESWLAGHPTPYAPKPEETT